MLKEAIVKMNIHDQMKNLMEAVDPAKYDEPKAGYSNTPKEQTLDMKTMNDMGNDLNRKKNAQFRAKDGDNPMAMTPVKVLDVQESLQRKYEEFLKEGE